MSFIVYPAIDLRAGKVVRLQEGDPARMTAYSDAPADTARRWLDAGARWLHVVNLDGAFAEADEANRLALKDMLQITREWDAHVQLGGGMRSLAAIDSALSLGVRRVVLGTIAAEKPEVVGDAIKTFGRDRIVAGIDARNGIVRVRGWKEASGITAADLAVRMRTLGLRTIIFTDVSRDGLGRGLNMAATRVLSDVSGLDIIASGGVNTLADITAAREANLAGVIVGRALYEGTVDLQEAIHGGANVG